MEDKKVIGIAQVQQDLRDGMTRDEIAVKYDITKSECKRLFMHDELKGRKTIKAKEDSFTIVADTNVNAVEAAKVEVVAETVAPTKPEPIADMPTKSYNSVTTDGIAEEEAETTPVAAEAESEKGVWVD